MPLYRLLVAGLLFLAVAPLPYGYYQFLRLAVCAAAVYCSWQEFENDVRGWGWLFIVVAILFNPVAPIHLDRSVWFFLDLGSGVLFIASVVAWKRRNTQKGSAP